MLTEKNEYKKLTIKHHENYCRNVHKVLARVWDLLQPYISGIMNWHKVEKQNKTSPYFQMESKNFAGILSPICPNKSQIVPYKLFWQKSGLMSWSDILENLGKTQIFCFGCEIKDIFHFGDIVFSVNGHWGDWNGPLFWLLCQHQGSQDNRLTSLPLWSQRQNYCHCWLDVGCAL